MIIIENFVLKAIDIDEDNIYIEMALIRQNTMVLL